MKADGRFEKKLVVAVVTVLFAAGILIPAWMIASRPGPSQVSAPLPLGTNRLKVGARLYSPHRTNEFFTVLDINSAYDFPDEDTRPAVKITSETIGGSSWVPREGLNKYFVVQ